mmetsp:Transcript_93564/g.175968  ORF Transcript_93564/g.175968 Transcript_93564/m.175968 type:complete len:179 (+) Transcript_93564:69-605(+)
MMLRSSVRRAGGLIDGLAGPGWKDKLWNSSYYPTWLKSLQVSRANSAFESSVAGHKRWQGILLWFKSFEPMFKPSFKYRKSYVAWKLQEVRGTLHTGRWYEGPYGSDYRPGNTFDRLQNVKAPYTDAEWQEMRAYRSYDIVKLSYGLLGIFLLYRVSSDWPVVWCDDRAPENNKEASN